MIDLAQIQKARQRARARLKVNPVKPRIRVMAGVSYAPASVAAAAAPEPEAARIAPEIPAEEERTPLQLVVDNAPVTLTALADDEAPFDPPDTQDIFGLYEEPDDFAELAPAHTFEETADIKALNERLEETFAPEPPVAIESAEEELEFVEEAPQAVVASAPEEAAATTAIADDEPPFDPPEPEEEIVLTPVMELEPIELTPLDPVAANENAPSDPKPAPAPPAPQESAPRRAPPIGIDQSLYEQPVPPITIHASWDRPDMGDLLNNLAADPRMSRASMRVERGGLDGAILHLKSNPSPDLLILDSNLRAPEILAGLARLADVIEHGAKIIFVGAVNDIGLMRELSACGIKYVVPPIREDDLARCVCGMYAEAHTSRVIAVMGARGGVGASTIAHNLAWSIAERQDMTATLVDLDLSFGAAAFSARLDAPRSIADLGETPYERVAVKQTTRLQVLAAPTQLARDFDLDRESVQAVIQQARRTSAYVVLDLPHAWNPWVQQALALADDVVLVASPDLASLRNADQIVKALQGLRNGKESPLFALSMTGMPKRPEIPAKDFATALGAAPLASLAYEPALFGGASIKGQMLYEAAPRAKAALTIDALATAITGHEPVVRKKTVSSILREPDKKDAAVVEADSPLDLARPASEEYLARARDAATAALTDPQPSAGGFGMKPRSNKLRVAAYIAALLIVGAAWAIRGASEASAAPSPHHHIASRH